MQNKFSSEDKMARGGGFEHLLLRYKLSSETIPTSPWHPQVVHMRVAKYVRVSTNLQDFKRQEDGLNEYIKRNKDWKFYASFDDMITGKHDQRDGFQRMMKSARSHRFQVLVVWDLDRLGRSLVDLIHNCNELMKLKIQSNHQ